MTDIEPMSVNEAVEADIEHKYWFAHGETPLGGSDFIRPLQVCGDMIECETGNFHDKISISVSEYMKKRQHPLEKVGLWDFTPPGPANHLIRLAHRNPDSVGRRLYEAEAEADRLRAERDAAITQLSAEASLRGTVEAKLDGLLAILCRDGGQYQKKHGTNKAIEYAKNRVYDLQAVVERLPKTADGVPVVSGMELHSAEYPNLRNTTVLYVWQDGTPNINGPSPESWADLYSTREAAEQAIRSTQQEAT